MLPLARSVLETNLHSWCPAKKLVRLPGVAPGPSPWQEDILLLNHSRRKVKGRQPCVATGPLPFQQRTNTSWSSGDANPRFHGGRFGVYPIDTALCALLRANPELVEGG